MRKIIVLVLVVLSFSLFACGKEPTVPLVKQNQSKDNDSTEPSQEKDKTDQSKNNDSIDPPKDEDKNIIELQGFNVIIPAGYTGIGGHDGVRYINAIVTPKNPNLTYEIEIGYGMAATSSDFESNMAVRGHYNDAIVQEVLTDEWLSKGSAYTFIRIHGNDAGAFTKFQEDKGPSQVMGLYRDNKWLEAELRITSGSLSDYPDVLAEFMAIAIDWHD